MLVGYIAKNTLFDHISLYLNSQVIFDELAIL